MEHRKIAIFGLAMVMNGWAIWATAAPPAASTTCNSCSDCSTKLASGSWDVVVLTTDIVDHGGSCVSLVLGESNVVFDCDGHVIDGDDIAIDPDYGISMYHGAGNSIINCTVSDFSAGIRLWDMTGCTVAGNTVFSNGVGIDLGFAIGNDVNDNISTDNYTGVYIDNSSANAISSNWSCYNSSLDFNLVSGSGNSGSDNVCDAPDGWNDAATSGCTWTCLIFANGFETGGTELWSNTVQ